MRAALPHLYELALGGTAVGTGLNAPKGYAEGVAAELAKLTGYRHTALPDRIEAASWGAAALATRGDIYVRGAHQPDMTTFLSWIEASPPGVLYGESPDL